MTTSEQTSFEADAPPTNLYSGSIDIPEGEDNLDDGSGDPGTVIGDDTGFGCDPTEISGCDDAATYSDSQSDTGSDEVASSSATLTSGTDSGGGGSWFNRTGAVADADAHAHNARGGLYSRLGSSDCTNFVSQAWHFGGGLHMTKYWNIRHAFNPNLSLSNWTRKWTASWGAVRNFVDYMVNHRQIASIMTISPSAPYTGGEIGDAVEYDWGYGDGWSHLALIVRTGSTNDDLIDQHNYDRFRSSWRRGYEQQQDPTVRRAMRTRVVHVHVQ